MASLVNPKENTPDEVKMETRDFFQRKRNKTKMNDVFYQQKGTTYCHLL